MLSATAAEARRLHQPLALARGLAAGAAAAPVRAHVLGSVAHTA